MKAFKEFFEEIPSWLLEKIKNNYWQAKTCQKIWERSLVFRAEVCSAEKEQTRLRILKTLDRY